MDLGEVGSWWYSIFKMVWWVYELTTDAVVVGFTGLLGFLLWVVVASLTGLLGFLLWLLVDCLQIYGFLLLLVVLGMFSYLCCWGCVFTDLKHKFLSLATEFVFFHVLPI
jgi:hypothetical protein